MQFAIGVLVFHEPMPTGRWTGFGLVWVALAIISAESLVNGRRVARARREPVATAVGSIC